MPTSLENKDIYKVSAGDLYTFSKISIGNVIVYSAGNTVTYYIDTNVVYQEEVDADETVLSPKTFTPAKSGWEFVGWRQDKVASDDALSSLIMGDDPITLYAVFQKSVTLSYNGNGSTEGSTAAETKQRYYNNGTVSNPQFTVKDNGFKKTDYSFVQWRLDDAESGTVYVPDDTIILSEDATLYAEWKVAAQPFYVVENRICKYNLNPPNINYAIYWEPISYTGMMYTLGDTGHGKLNQTVNNIQAQTDATSYSSEVVYKIAAPIPTKNCTKLSFNCNLIGGNVVGFISIDDSEEKPISGTVTFDITSKTSVKIKLKFASTSNYTYIGCTLNNIRLY